MRMLFLTLLWALLSPLTAYAERVTPSERVTESISIREAPTSDSELLGELAVGETLELLGSVPWWYKVRLENISIC